MTVPVGQLLVSVRDLAEAIVARANGVAIVDFKEPAAGPLGPVPVTVRREVAEHERSIRSRNPAVVPPLHSLALGELRDWRGADLEDLDVFRALKLGLAGMGCQPDWPDLWRDAMSQQGSAVIRVLVAYADAESCDAPSPEEVLEAARAAGGDALLVDTFQKDGRTSLDVVGLKRLGQLVERGRATGLKVAFAGSLGLAEIPLLMKLRPWVLGFRGAACDGGRGGSISALKVRQLAEAISALDSAG